MPKDCRTIVGRVEGPRRSAAQKARARIERQEKEERLSLDSLQALYTEELDTGQQKNHLRSSDSSSREERFNPSEEREKRIPSSQRIDRCSYSSSSSIIRRDQERYSTLAGLRSIAAPGIFDREREREKERDREREREKEEERTREGALPIPKARSLLQTTSVEREGRLPSTNSSRYIYSANRQKREEPHQSSRSDNFANLESVSDMSRKGEKTDDLKNILMSFKLAELQTLLATCGRSRSGRKHELLGRACSLLKSSEGSSMRERVRSRILELYHERYIAIGENSPEQSEAVVTPPSSFSRPTSYPQPYTSSYSNDKDKGPYLNRSSYHKYEPSSQGYLLPQTMAHPHDNRLYKGPVVMPPASAMPIHPDVRFIPLPFYDVVDDLIKPTSLVQKTLNGIQETNLVYHFTPYQTQLIINSRLYHIKSMMEYAVQVQLRFCLAETSCVQEDLYPTRCRLIINGKGCNLPGQPPPNAQNQEPRKPHRPINITSLCILSPMQSNQIQIQWMPSELGQRHVATVHLVKIVQAETLVQQLRNKPARSKAHSIDFIKEKLRPDPDSEIAMTSLKVSLCCPIGMTRMVMPCRGKNCNHLQCFDGSLYVQMNERKPSWLCPVCDQKAYYNDLFKDDLFTSIINEAKECDEIVFFEDGSWRPLADIQQSSGSGSKVSPEKTKTPGTKNVVDCPALINDPGPVSTTAASDVSESTSTGDKEIQNDDEDDVEIIMIDDSDSEADIPVGQSIIEKAEIVPRFSPSAGSSGDTIQPSLSSSNTDPESFELCNIPRDDRVAAELNQSSSATSLTQSTTGIIDISDE